MMIDMTEVEISELRLKARRADIDTQEVSAFSFTSLTPAYHSR